MCLTLKGGRACRLNCPRIVGNAVTDRTEIQHIETETCHTVTRDEIRFGDVSLLFLPSLFLFIIQISRFVKSFRRQILMKRMMVFSVCAESEMK